MSSSDRPERTSSTRNPRHAETTCADSGLEQLQGLSALHRLGLSFRKRGLPTSEWDSAACGLAWLRSAVWTNPHNLCYMNATLRCRLRATQGLSGPAEACSRVGAAAVRALASKAPTNVLERCNWRPLLEAWLQPSIQHDCSEFLAHPQP